MNKKQLKFVEHLVRAGVVCAIEHHLGKTKTALFNHSISPQNSIKKHTMLVWLSGRALPW